MLKPCLITVLATACLGVVPLAAAGPPAGADAPLAGWIREVLSQVPELQAAEAAVVAAGGRLQAAGRPLFNPELEFEHESSDIDTTTGEIRQTIDWADKRGARTEVARSDQVAAVADLQARRQALAADLLRALAEWNTASAVAGVSERQRELMARFARLAEQRRQAGDLGQVELDLAHLAAAEAEFEHANAVGNLIHARQALTELAGGGHTPWPVVSGPLPELDPQQVDVARLLDALPSLRAAMARVAAARGAVSLSARERRPDPTVGIRAGKEDSDALTGFTLSVPLYVRNTFSAEVDVANAELIQAERQAGALRRHARAGMIAAAQAYRNAQQAWSRWSASGAPRLSQRTELLGRLWQAGEMNTTDYLVQLKQALETEVSAAEQHGRMWRAWADWLAASGRVSQWLGLAGETQ